jgi:ankyrin repeat protein
VERVRKTLEKVADPNAKDKDSWTPLHRATFEDYVEVVRLLVEHRADQTVKNILRKTPLEVARA